MPLPGIYASSMSAFTLTGNYYSLASFTVPTGQTAASIIFAGIPAGYRSIELACSLRTDASTNGGNSVFIQFNGDTGSNYSRHFAGGYAGSSAGLDVGAAGSQTSINTHVCTAANNLASTWGAGYITVMDYASSSKNKTARSIGGYSQNGATGYEYAHIMGGAWYSTAPITTVTVFATGSFVAGSSIELYGIK